jgi:hypothetical protein
MNLQLQCLQSEEKVQQKANDGRDEAEEVEQEKSGDEVNQRPLEKEQEEQTKNHRAGKQDAEYGKGNGSAEQFRSAHQNAQLCPGFRLVGGPGLQIIGQQTRAVDRPPQAICHRKQKQSDAGNEDHWQDGELKEFGKTFDVSDPLHERRMPREGGFTIGETAVEFH